jgi:membrane protease YdiL (CAAX protease family)
VSEAPAPVPRPRAALALTAIAWSVMVLVTVLTTPAEGGVFGLALGLLLGFGGAGTLAARSVAPPAERRIGLVGFAPRLLLPLVLLAPVVLLASELDNWIAALFFPAAETAAEGAAGPDTLATLEWVLFAVLLRPVLEEFFFRGVVQQGVVAALGPARGVLLTALLFSFVRTSVFGADAYHAVSLGAQSLATGLLLGFVRLSSGSILACVLLQTALEGAGVLSLVLRESLPIPGFNAAGAHTPLAWLLPAALSVGLGVALLGREVRRTSPDYSRKIAPMN